MEAEPAHGSLDTEEGVVPRGLRKPQLASKRERDEHLPYRDSCDVCVRATGRKAAHRQRSQGEKEEHGQVPRVAMDFFYMNEKDRAEDANPLFVMMDEETSDKYSRVVEKKRLGGNGERERLVKDISGELKAWGHLGGEGHRLILKSDGECPMRTLKEAVRKYHGGVVMMEVSDR